MSSLKHINWYDMRVNDGNAGSPGPTACVRVAVEQLQHKAFVTSTWQSLYLVLSTGSIKKAVLMGSPDTSPDE